MMNTVARRRIRGVVAVAIGSAVAVSLVAAPNAAQGSPGSAPQPTGTPVDEAVAAAATNPRYSNPTFLPIRAETRASCVKTNCRKADGTPYHGDWAIDFLGEFGDGIYAAGYGIAYVGGRHNGCRQTSDDRRGNWVWIDHGGGILTRYYHLQSISIRNGQAVTPDTKIGAMGSSGAPAPCSTPYTHFQVMQTRGERISRIEPQQLGACHGQIPVRYPDAIGYSRWDDTDPRQDWLHSTGTSCLATSPRSSEPLRTTARTDSSLRSATVRWKSPRVNSAKVIKYAISTQKWHPSTKAWSKPRIDFATTSARSFRISQLSRWRTYRIRVAAVDRAGASRWVRVGNVVMARKPARPRTRIQHKSARSVKIRWAAANHRGLAVTGYRMGIARIRRGKVLRMKWRTRGATRRAFRWRKLRPGRRYVVAVRAQNPAGRGSITRIKVRLPR